MGTDEGGAGTLDLSDGIPLGFRHVKSKEGFARLMYTYTLSLSGLSFVHPIIAASRPQWAPDRDPGAPILRPQPETRTENIPLATRPAASRRIRPPNPQRKSSKYNRH
jgi:hypothetical protein